MTRQSRNRSEFLQIHLVSIFCDTHVHIHIVSPEHLIVVVQGECSSNEIIKIKSTIKCYTDFEWPSTLEWRVRGREIDWSR